MSIQLRHSNLLTISILFLTCSIAVAHSWMAPKEFSKMINPITQDSASTSRGEIVFLENCAACHGDNAKGLSTEKTNLEINTPNLVQRLATHSDGDFFWKIQEGKGGMPAFKKDIDENDIWDVINFIKALE